MTRVSPETRVAPLESNCTQPADAARATPQEARPAASTQATRAALP